MLEKILIKKKNIKYKCTFIFQHLILIIKENMFAVVSVVPFFLSFLNMYKIVLNDFIASRMITKLDPSLRDAKTDWKCRLKLYRSTKILWLIKFSWWSCLIWLVEIFPGPLMEDCLGNLKTELELITKMIWRRRVIFNIALPVTLLNYIPQLPFQLFIFEVWELLHTREINND